VQGPQDVHVRGAQDAAGVHARQHQQEPAQLRAILGGIGVPHTRLLRLLWQHVPTKLHAPFTIWVLGSVSFMGPPTIICLPLHANWGIAIHPEALCAYLCPECICF